MFKHVLFPTDGSELSERAALNTVQLAKSTSARLTAVTVSIPFHLISIDPVMLTDTEDVYRKNCESRATKYLDVVRRAAESGGVTFEGLHVFHEHPYVAIIDAASGNACDVICMASHGRKGVVALVLGSETLKVLTHSKIPVVVWR
ncbi:MAG: universal stress protein [Burkholderiales bacterium]